VCFILSAKHKNKDYSSGFNLGLKKKLRERLQDAKRILRGDSYEILYGATYNNLGCATIHNPECVSSDVFLRAFERGLEGFSENEKIAPAWNAYVCCWAARQVLNLDGDFVECGVWKGCLTGTVLNYTNNLDNRDKKFWLFDTFDGFVEVESYFSKNEKAKYGGGYFSACYRNAYDTVKHKFKNFSNVRIIKGSVPDTLVSFSGDKVCYLSIDMNCAYPEIEAIKFFWDKLVLGAIVILDDYNWVSHVEQKRAFDKFAQEHGFEVLALATGQGLIIKNR
jgi:hypothetical protein